MSIQEIWRILQTIIVICGIGFGSVTQTVADQTDPRLNDLFDRLQDVTLPADVVSTERQIWTIWLEPTDAATQQLLKDGMQSMSRGEYQAALKAFDQLVALAPEFAEGWNKRATLHYLMDNLDRSLEDIARTLELEPRHFGALSGRGACLCQDGRPGTGADRI